MRVPTDRQRALAGAGSPQQVRGPGAGRQPTRTIHRSRRSMDGFGVHDVIIETPDHSHVIALMPDAHVGQRAARL